MAFFDKVKNTITTGIKNTVKGVAEKSFATPKAPSYTQPKKTAYQNITAQPVETKWYKGAVPTASEMEARAIKVGQQDYQRGEYLYGLFQETQNDPTSPLYNPYTKSTSQAASELSAMGFDVSDPNFIQNNAWLKGEYRLGTSGSPLAPSNSSTTEQNAAYWYNKYMDDEETTLKAEQEWAALQEEVGYWAGRKDRNLTDEEIFSKINWNNYPTLKRMDEAKGKGLSVGLTRPIGYSQDALNGVIYGKRNGVEGDPSRLAVRAAYDGSTGYQRNEEIAARLNPNSDMYNPYAVGSTIDDQALYFGVDSFDKDWVANNRQYMSSMDETERRMYNAVAKAEANTSSAETEHAALMAYIDEQIAAGETDPDEIIEKVYGDGWGFDMAENGKTLAKMDESLEPGGTPMAMTRAVPYSRNDVERYIQERCEAENQKKGMDAVVGGLQSFMEKFLTPKELTATEKIAADTKRLVEKAVPPTAPEVPEATSEVPEATSEVPAAEDVELGLLPYTRKNPAEIDAPAVKVDEVINPATAMAQMPANPVNPPNPEAMKVTASVVVSHGTEDEKKALKYHVANGSLANTRQFSNKMDRVTAGGMINHVADNYALTNGVQIRRADGASSHGENARLLAETEQIAAENAETIAREKEYAEYVDGVGDISRVGKLNNLTDEQKESAKEYAYAVGIQRSSGDRYWERKAFEAMEASGMDEETIAFVQNIVSEWADDTGYSTDETNNGEVLEMRMEKVVDENPYEGLTPKGGELSEAEKKAAFLEDKIAEYKAGVAADEEYQKFIDKKPGLERLRSMANGVGGRQAYGGFDGIEDAIDYSFDVIEFVPPERKMNQDWQDARYMAEQSGINDVDSYMKWWAEKTIADYDIAIEKNNEILRYIKPDENGNVAIPGYTEDEIAAIEAETDRVERKKYETEMYLLTRTDGFEETALRAKAEFFQNPYSIKNDASTEWLEDLVFGGHWDAGAGIMHTDDTLLYLTEEEKNIIYYLYKTERSGEARKYYNYLTSPNTGVVNMRRRKAVEEGWTEFAENWPVISDLAAVAVTPIDALGSLSFMAEVALGGNPDAYDPRLDIGAGKQALVTDRHRWAAETFGEGSTGEAVFNLFYDATFSAGESLVMSLFTGGINIGANAQSVLGKFGFKILNSTLAAAPMATIGAQRTFNEIYSQTGNKEKALMMAGVSFAAETFSESISIDNIRSAFKGGAEGTRRFLQELVPNMFEEGTGEMISAVIEQIGDDVIMDEYSKREGLIEKYHAEGMSLEDAAIAADKEILKNILYSGMMGSLSAGVSTSVPYVAGRAGSNISQTENTETVSTPDYVEGQTVEAVQGTEPVASNAFGGLAILAGVEGDDVNAQAKTEAVAAALVTSEEQMPSAIASAQEMNSEYGDKATRNFVVDVITKAGMNAQTAGAIVAASLSKGESHQMLTSMVTGETEVTPETVNQLVETAEADAQNPEIQGEIMGNIQRSVISNAVIDAGNAGGFNSIASQQTAVQTIKEKLDDAQKEVKRLRRERKALGDSLNNAAQQYNATGNNQMRAYMEQLGEQIVSKEAELKQAKQTVDNNKRSLKNAYKQLELTKATTLDNLRKQETQRIAEEAAQIDKNTKKVYNSDEVRNNAVQPGSINQGQELDHGQLSAASGRNDGRGNNLYAQPGTGQDEAGRGTESRSQYLRQDESRVPARLLSKEANENLTKNGVTNQPLYMESDLERFSNALEEAKSSNDHGAYVDGQSVDSLKEKGAKIIMSEDGLSGAAVGTAGKEKGNIFGVFKSKQSNAKKASAQLMIQAVANGGNKLDCFDGNLRNIYSSVGFVPVARVAFNEEYAPDGWNYERDGKPDVVFWIHNGDDADVVAQKYGKGESEGGYHVYTSEEIAELPLFEDYDEAWDYRDGMMNEESEADISTTGGNGNIFSDQNNDAEPMPRQKERQFASKTLPESDAPGEAVQALLNDPEQLYYTPTTNREQVQKAYARIQEEGYEAAIQRVLNLEKMNANDNADAYTLLAMAKDKGDIPGFIELARKVNVEGTEQGRTLQIRTLLKRMTPTGIQTWAAGRAESDLTDWMAKHLPEMKAVNKRAEKVSEDIRDMDLTSVENQRWGQDVNKRQLALIKTYNLEKVSRPGVNYNRATRKQRMLEAILATPDPLEMTGNGLNLIQRLELIKKGKEVITVADLRYMAYNMEAFMNLEDQDSRQADIYLARTYEAYGNVRPATVGEKSRTWRYTSMLLSIPSAARNVIGNALQNFDNAIAHGVATAIDKGVGKITGERTTASISMQDRVDGWKKFVEETKNTFRDYFVDKAVTQRGENRFNTNQRGRVFENSISESMRLVEGYLMSAGDRNFWKKAYFNSIAEQRRVAELNGVDFDLEQALEQAEQDANFATFNEDGKVRNTLQTMKKAVPFLDYIIPFTGTPTNIIRRMIQFSPIGLATNMVKHGVNRYVRKQTFDQHQFVNDMARGLVGTMKFVGGIGLAMLGVIKVGYGDEEDDKVSGVESAQGKPYSFYITINGQNYDLSTFAPPISPLIMGVAAFEIFKNDKNALNAVQSAAIAMGDQIFEASYMSGVRDVFKGFGSPTENIVTTLASNMLGQNIPAFLGQLASSLDPYVRDTKDKDYIMQTLKTGLINKIPVLRSTLLPEKVDVAGRSFANTDQYVALFDPFNRTAAVDDPTLDELMRLNESLGTSDFMPTNFLSGSKNTISGYEGELTDKQKETCKKRYGELWRLGGETLDKDGNKVVITGMEELMNSDAYQKMNDVEKANALAGIMQAAKDGATREAVEAAGLKKKGTAEKPTKKTTRAMPEQFAGRTDGVFGKLAERYEATGDGAYIPKGIGSSFERSEGKGENKKTYSYNLTPEEHDELYAIYENKLTKKLKEIDWNAPEEVVAQAVENAYSSAATSAKDEWHKDHK